MLSFHLQKYINSLGATLPHLVDNMESRLEHPTLATGFEAETTPRRANFIHGSEGRAAAGTRMQLCIFARDTLYTYAFE